MVGYTVDNIYGVLDVGPVFRGKRLAWLWCALLMPLLFPLLVLGAAITVWAGEMEWDADIIFTLVIANIFGLIAFGTIIYMFIRNNRLKKNIAEWITDAVAVDASIRRLELTLAGAAPVQLEISFEHDGKIFCIISTDNMLTSANNKQFLKFADSNSKLLYSPKYNRVLFPCKSATNVNAE